MEIIVWLLLFVINGQPVGITLHESKAACEEARTIRAAEAGVVISQCASVHFATQERA